MTSERLIASASTIVACAALLSQGVSTAPAQHSIAQVAVLPFTEVPVSINSGRVNTATDPATVTFNVTNVGTHRIRAYQIRVFVIPPSDQGHGFVSVLHRPENGIEAGQSDKAMMSLLQNRTYGSETAVILAVTCILFEDGTQWTVPVGSMDLIQQVRDLAASLQSATGR